MIFEKAGYSMRTLVILGVVGVSLIGHSPAFAANASPGSATVGSALQEYANERKEANMEKRLKTKPVKKPSIDAPEITVLPGGRGDVYIVKVIVQANTPVEKEMGSAILKMTAKYEGRNLSLIDMKHLAREITDTYTAKKCRAYVPEQSFNDNALYINFVFS